MRETKVIDITPRRLKITRGEKLDVIRDDVKLEVRCCCCVQQSSVHSREWRGAEEREFVDFVSHGVVK